MIGAKTISLDYEKEVEILRKQLFKIQIENDKLRKALVNVCLALEVK